MARPKKADREKRRKPMSFRPENEDEEKDILAKVKRSGLSLSDYLRRSARSAHVVIRQAPAKSETDFALVHELNKIGVNLNQIVRSMHRKQKLPPELPRMLETIETYVMQATQNHGANDR